MTLGSMEHILRHGRVFFIYDTERCRREQDDPEEALCFLQPRLGGDHAPLPADALHLVCQLMGAALFTERNMGTFPGSVQLQHGELVLFRDGRFIWAMHTSGEDATSVTRQRLLRTRRALRLLLGGTEALSAAASDQLARCLRPLLAAGAGPPPLHVLFDVPPRLDWAQKDELMGRQLDELLAAIARLTGTLTCVLCWDGQAVSTGSIESIVHLLIHIYYLPEGVLTPAAKVMSPAGALTARVHLEQDIYSSLRQAAQPHWCQSTPRPSVMSAPPPLASIEERAESRTTSSGTATACSPPDATDRGEAVRQRRRRRRQCTFVGAAPAAAAAAAERTVSATAAAAAAPLPVQEDGSENALCIRIGALALQALSAECGRRSPEPSPPLEQIPVRRLRRAPLRRHSSSRRRSLSDLDLPEPCSNLAFLKRHEPELYRQELRTLQAGLRDNAPTFSSVAANAYSFGIPRSNRLYTPRAATAGAPSPPASAGLRWRRWGSAGGTGYCSEAEAAAAAAPAGRRRFHSEGEQAGWRPRQLSQLFSEGEPPAALPPDPEPTPATLYVKTCGKLKCFVLLETHETTLQSQIEELDRVCSGGVEGLQVLLGSYRSIPSFHGQHYSYCSWRTPAGSRPALLETEGAPQLDLRLVQMLHSDLQQGHITDCRIRTPSDVVLAQRSGSTHTFYQQPTSGHQHGLPVVNGPLSRVDERAQQRLAANHRLRLAT